MSDFGIGNWVRRDEPDTRWHEVESVVAGAAITQCGLRLEPYISNGRGLKVSETTPLDHVCKRC